MRVLQLASGDGWGGAERALLAIVDGTRTSGDVETSALLLNEGRLARELRERGVALAVLPEHSLGLLALVRALHRHLRRERIDVVHAHRYKELLLAAIARPRGCRFVATVHGLEPWSQAGFGTSLRNWLCIGAARLRGARFAAVSAELARRLARRLGRRSVVHVPNPVTAAPQTRGVEPLRARLGLPAGAMLVGFVGRLERVKGPDRLLDVAHRLPSDVALVLIGGGSLAGELARRIEDEGLAGRVTLLGELTDAAACLPELDALALTSRHEGLPLVLLEAAAAALPVVGYDVGGVREVLGDSPAARLVSDGDVAAFAQALGALLHDRESTRAQAAAWGRQVRARFDPARAAAAYLALYRGEAPAQGT